MSTFIVQCLWFHGSASSYHLPHTLEYISCWNFVRSQSTCTAIVASFQGHNWAPPSFVPHPLIPRPHPALCPTLSFAGPSKLFVACSDDKQGKAWEMWLLQFNPNPHHTAFIPHHSQLPTSYIPDLHSFLSPPPSQSGHSLQPS